MRCGRPAFGRSTCRRLQRRSGRPCGVDRRTGVRSPAHPGRHPVHVWRRAAVSGDERLCEVPGRERLQLAAGFLGTRLPVIQLCRSAMLFTSNATNFFAIVYIPLAKTASISLMAPLVVVPLAWAMLGERTTPGRLVALAVGFVGVLIVIRPGTELFHWASLLAVVSAVG